MTSKIPRKLLPLLGLSLVMVSGCIKSVCANDNDCPTGNVCGEEGACLKRCTVDDDCPSGRFCNLTTGLCPVGCRSSAECPSEHACAQNKCWPINSSTPLTDGGPENGGTDDGGSDDGGLDQGGSKDAGALVCSCLRAPRACLVDINPASSTVGSSVCEPSSPPRATLMFFGNVGCSHCQSIFGQLLEIESQLRNEGFNPTLAFIQLKTWDYTGEEVASTFPTHRGPVLQDTDSDDMWEAYGADWYEVKIIDTHGCLSAFFASPDTTSLLSGGRLLTAGSLVKEAWISAMGHECHAVVDAGMAAGNGP